MRAKIIELVHEHYDPMPKDWPRHRCDWDDGTGDIADRVLGVFQAALREHWLTGIVCDHEAKTDRATCSCSEWRCDPMPNVGAAVDAWIAHVQSAVSSTVRSPSETKGNCQS